VSLRVPGSTESVDRSTDVGTCPRWCTVDHAADVCLFREDVAHVGRERGVWAPRHGGPAVPLLRTRLMQYPFATSAVDQQVFVSVEALDDGEAAELRTLKQVLGLKAQVWYLHQHLAELTREMRAGS
jgi:hypothetical protein